jgi:hypothetical protein
MPVILSKSLVFGVIIGSSKKLAEAAITASPKLRLNCLHSSIDLSIISLLIAMREQ